jgi:hypothetical protein
VLCRDAAADQIKMVGIEWADIEEHRRIRELVAREIGMNLELTDEQAAARSTANLAASSTMTDSRFRRAFAPCGRSATRSDPNRHARRYPHPDAMSRQAKVGITDGGLGGFSADIANL